MGACASKLRGAVKADEGDAPIPMKEEVVVKLSKDVSVPEPTVDEVVAAPPETEKEVVVVSEKSLEIDGSSEQDIEKRRSLSLLFKEDLTDDKTLSEEPAKPEEILVTENTIEQCETKTREIEVEKKLETPVVSEIEKSEIKTPEIEVEAPKTVQVTEVTPVSEAKPGELIETVKVVTEQQCETKTPEIEVEQKPETVVEPEIEKHEIVTEQVPVVYVEAPEAPVVAETPPVTPTEVKPEEPSKIEKITEQGEIKTPEIKERTLQEIEPVTEQARDTNVEAPKAEEVAVPLSKPEEPLKTEKAVTKTPEIEVEKKADTPVKPEIEKSDIATDKAPLAPKTEELAITPPVAEIKKPEISEEKK